jgi:hypothetical protein
MADGAISDTIVGGVAAGGGFAAIWHGVKWSVGFLTGRHDKRAAELDRREAELAKKIDERLGQLEATVTKLEEEQRRTRVAVSILVAKVARDDPGAPELRQVREILRDSFPVDYGLPSDHQASLDKLK